MSRWFRFYSDAMRNPKVAILSDSDFRLWVDLLALAADNDGVIPCLEALKSLLMRRLDHLKAGVNRLVKGGLIDVVGDGFEPHNWRKFQYKSDSSTDRVKRFRNVARNVTETPPETEAEADVPLDKSNGAKPDPDKAYWANAKDYLSDHGVSNPGAMVGKWNRDFGKVETAKAITASQIERAVDPVSYITRTLRGAAKPTVKIGI